MAESNQSSRNRLGAGAAMIATLALVLGACSGAGASNVPTVPAGVPTLPPGSGSACLDAATLAILDQLKATGADVPAILAANKDKLVAGLNAFQPTDPAVVTWRDALVTAIGSNDAVAVATQVAVLSSGQVTIPPC
jgi:ABC-type phosphate/phosphonate transport system substrate-binding protein